MENKTKLRKWAFITALIGCGQFILLTTIAMVVYPGGTVKDPNTTRYLFFYNFFSDLGRDRTYLGESNLASRTLFTIALTFVGISLIFYFIAMPAFFNLRRASKWLSIIASINGTLSAIAYIGIGFAPADLYLTPHMIFVYFGFTSLILTLVFYTIAIFLDEKYPNFYAWNYGLFAVILIAYLVILYAGSSFSSSHNFLIQVIGQKIIVYTEIVSFAIQAFGAWYLLHRQDKIEASNVIQT